MINKDVVVRVMKRGNVFAEHIGNTLQPFGLSLQQFNVLRILRGRNGAAASLESITDDMIHSMSNTSRIVDKLLEKGCVERTVCPENRRKVNIFMFCYRVCYKFVEVKKKNSKLKLLYL